MLSGGISMMYPNICTFVNDRNTITLKYTGAGNNTVGGAFTLTNQQGTAVNIAYNSEQQYLVFNLFSVLKKLMNNDVYSVVTVSGTVVSGETATNIQPFTLKCIDGRTLHSRPHCSERIIYYYDNTELNGVEILSLEGGTVGGYTVQAGISKFNLSHHTGDFVIMQTDGDTTHLYSFKKSVIGGESGYNTDCGDGESVGGLLKVRYINIDGCLRYLQGKITNRKRSVNYNEWRADELVRHTPNGMITQTTDEVTVGFPSVARESYAEDILFSPIVEYLNENNEWQPCVISSKIVNLKDWSENDIEITFQILA